MVAHYDTDPEVRAAPADHPAWCRPEHDGGPATTCLGRDPARADDIYDEITELLASICDVPFARISLVHGDYPAHQSIYGELDRHALTRASSFCEAVIAGAQPLEVADAAHDVRFHTDPLVTGGPHIRFYAGAPLMSSAGLTVGTLSVMDRVPRSLSHSQRVALSQLTDVVMRLLEARRSEEKATWLGEIIDGSLSEVLVFDARTRGLIHANRGACRNLGYRLEEIIGFSAERFVDGWNEARRQEVQGPLLRGEREVSLVDVRVRRRDGSVYPAEGRVQLAQYQGRPVFVVNAQDISARKEAEEALYREKELAQITLASIGDAMITTDEAGQVSYLNPVAERLTGWTNEAARGRPLDQVFHIVSEQDRLRVDSPVDRVLQTGEITGLANNTVLIARDGREFSVEDSAAPIRSRSGRLIGVVLVFRDVTRARELAHHLSWQASHDALTELANRREFERLLAGLLQSAGSRQMRHVLLYLDLDQFKVVNDSCGHQAGDELLKQLASLLLSRMRKSDTLARLGGDEFGVLLEGCNIEQAGPVAQQLLDAIRAFRFSWQGRLFSVSASIGAAEINSACDSPAQVMAAADTACFMAKDKGRNQIQVFRDDDEEVSFRQGEMGWASRLLQSVEENRFFLSFQHVRALDLPQPSGACEYIEVLLRMKDEHGRTIPPMTFIPAAERYHLMPTIDRWVIERTLHCIHRYSRAAAVGSEADLCRRARFAVNLSGVSLSDEHFLDFILDQFDKTGAPPAQLCFEITETAAISNLSRVARFMHRLKAMGCRFALDDFGSGLSSFAYLKNLPVDYLKIDGMFVKGSAIDATDFALVESINRIGHVMGMQTIAEFVESEDVLQRMQAIGVNYVQGYHVHQPESYPALSARLAKRQVVTLEELAG